MIMKYTRHVSSKNVRLSKICMWSSEMFLRYLQAPKGQVMMKNLACILHKLALIKFGVIS